MFLRGCAGTGDRRERKSHAVRRVRPDALRLTRGLGGTPTSTSEYLKYLKGYPDDLLAPHFHKPCFQTMSGIPNSISAISNQLPCLNQVQFLRGVFHCAPIFYTQFAENIADIGFYRGEFDAQNLPDLCIAFVVAQQP